MTQGSGLSTEWMGDWQTWPLSVCEDPINRALASKGCRLLPLIPFAAHFYVPTSLRPSNPGLIKQVCCSTACWTGCFCKCCLNVPPAKMTPQGLVRLVISSTSLCQEAMLRSSSVLQRFYHLWHVTMDRWVLSYDLRGLPWQMLCIN